MPSSQTTSYSLWTPTKQLTILSHQDFDPRSQLPSHPLSLWSFWESCVLIHPAHGPLSYWLISRIFLMSPTIRFLLVSRIELPWLLSGKVSACKAGDNKEILDKYVFWYIYIIIIWEWTTNVWQQDGLISKLLSQIKGDRQKNHTSYPIPYFMSYQPSDYLLDWKCVRWSTRDISSNESAIYLLLSGSFINLLELSKAIKLST